MVIWVVQATSQHLDFVEGLTGGERASQWHSIIDAGSAESQLSPDTDAKSAPNIISVWQAKQSPYEVVEYTQAVSH